MEFVELTAAQRQTFDEDGFLVVPGVLAPDAIGDLLETGDRLMAEFLNTDGEFYRQRREEIVQQAAFAL